MGRSCIASRDGRVVGCLSRNSLRRWGFHVGQLHTGRRHKLCRRISTLPNCLFFMCRWIASCVTSDWGVGLGVCLVNVTFYTQRLGVFMVYSDKAKAKRRCTATKKDGSRCLAYAIWDHPQQVCVAHSGRKRRRGLTHADRYYSLFEKIQTSKPLANGGSIATTRYRKKRNRQIKCDCAAYPFPHRPGGGYCRWPDAPLVQTARVKSDWGVSLYGIEVCPQQRKRKHH